MKTGIHFVVLVFLFLTTVVSLHAQDQEAESAENNPETIPELLGFEGGLQTGNVSASGNGELMSVLEQDRNGVLARTAEISFDGPAITIKVTRHFGPSQREELLEALPNLTEYTESFPGDAGEFDVELTVGLTRTFKADSVNEFSEKYPPIYQQYRSHFRFGDRWARNPIAGNNAPKNRKENLEKIYETFNEQYLIMLESRDKDDPIVSAMEFQLQRMEAQLKAFEDVEDADQDEPVEN